MQAGLLQPDSTWYLLKLSSMSTILREWNALHSVSDLKFKQVLLSGSVSAASRRINPLQIPQVRPVTDMTLCFIAGGILLHLLCCGLQGSAAGMLCCSTAKSAILKPWYKTTAPVDSIINSVPFLPPLISKLAAL